MTETPLTTPASPALRLTRRAGLVLGGGGALLLAVLVAVSVGAVPVPLSTVWGILAHHLTPGLVTPEWSLGRESIVWDIRFPRALLAALVGAGLGLTGAALQSVTRNPLADPHLLGISSAGAFGGIAALLHTGLFHGLHHRFGFGGRPRQRLFANDHLAGLGGRDGDLLVRVVGRADIDQVDVRSFDSLPPIRFDALIAPIIRKGLHLFRVARTRNFEDSAVIQREEIGQALVGIGVGPAHEAVPDHGDAKWFAHGA